VTEISSTKRIKTKPSLSILALISFIVTFLVARIFSSLYPETVWEISGFHIHHFWYGLIMLAIGGWLGISVENERINRIAAILFGAGGGLIGDQVGLLLTLNAHAYWADFTYTLVITFLAFVSILIFLIRYNKIIRTEFPQFLRSSASLYVGVFLIVVSIAFFLETGNTVITVVSGSVAVIAFIIIIAYFVQQIRMKLTKLRKQAF
jgi:FtsH-binding integral membrane protein